MNRPDNAVTTAVGEPVASGTPRTMAIGFFIQHFPPQLGGAENQARLLAEEVARRGHRVELLTTRHRVDLPKKTSLGLLTVQRLPTLAPRWLKLPVNLVSGFLSGLFVSRRVDLIHGHCLSPFVLGALLAAKLTKTPVMIKICSIGEEGDIAKVRRFVPGGFLWSLYSRADLFTVQTEAVAEELVREGIDGARVINIPGILEEQDMPAGAHDSKYFRQELGLEEKVTLVFVGRLHQGKGLGVLMQVWPQIQRQYGAQLLLVGEGPMREQIECWRLENGLSGSVILTGYQADPHPYYRASDIMVFPSHSEAFGNAIVEAMGHGLAVAATRVGVVSEWGDEAPIAIVDIDKPEEFARTLENLVKDETLRCEMGTRASGFVAGRFGVSALGECYIQQYRRLVNEALDHTPGHEAQT